MPAGSRPHSERCHTAGDSVDVAVSGARRTRVRAAEEAVAVLVPVVGAWKEGDCGVGDHVVPPEERSAVASSSSTGRGVRSVNGAVGMPSASSSATAVKFGSRTSSSTESEGWN